MVRFGNIILAAFVVCSLILWALAGYATPRPPQKVWQQPGGTAGNIFYGGGVFKDTFYTGQIEYGLQQWSSTITKDSALLKSACKGSKFGKSAVPLGKYIFCTSSIYGLFRMSGWDASTAVDLKLPSAESVVTDGVNLYTNDVVTKNRIHKYTVDPRDGSVREAWNIEVGAAKDAFNGISYYGGRIYAVDHFLDPAGDRGIYEIDASTGSSKMIAQVPNLTNRPNAYQAVRYGNRLFVTGLDGRLNVFSFNGSTWKLHGSYDLGLQDLYGIGVKGDGTNATNLWITSLNHTISYWTLPKPSIFAKLM